MRRCPYLEEFWKDSHGPLRVYHFDCHVDRRSKTRTTLRDRPPVCVGRYEDCPLYREEKRREDGTISRYTD